MKSNKFEFGTFLGTFLGVVVVEVIFLLTVMVVFGWIFLGWSAFGAVWQALVGYPLVKAIFIVMAVFILLDAIAVAVKETKNWRKHK